MRAPGMKKPPNDSAQSRIVKFFHRHGCLRLPDEVRRQKEGHTRYKKGHEIRFVADSLAELRQISSLLKRLGFKPGAPYQKQHQFVQPVYGNEAAASFMRILISEHRKSPAPNMEYLLQNPAFAALYEACKNEEAPTGKAEKKKRSK